MALFSSIYGETKRARRAGDRDGPLSFRRLVNRDASVAGSPKAAERKPDLSVIERPAVIEGPSALNLESIYEQAAEYLRKVLEAVREGNPFAIEPAERIMRRLIDSDYENDALFIKSIHGGERYDFTVHHSVNVAIYAAKMGASLGFSADRQLEIALLGLMHDVGIALIPEEIIHKQGALSPQEQHYFRERPRFSYELLKSLGPEYGYLAECALAIYERIDGSGYPNGLRGEEIHEYAQIVGLMDIYEAMIHSRPQRERFPHFFAVKEIVRTSKSKFRRDLLKALLNIFSVFPLNSYVRLNSGAVGQVMATYPDQPMRPKVRILYDGHNRKLLSERFVDLPTNSLLYIVDAVTEEELLEIAEAAETYSRPSTPAPPMEDAPEDAAAEEALGGSADEAVASVSETSAGGRAIGSRRWVFGAAVAACVLILAAALYTRLPGDPETAAVQPAAPAAVRDAVPVSPAVQAARPAQRDAAVGAARVAAPQDEPAPPTEAAGAGPEKATPRVESRAAEGLAAAAPVVGPQSTGDNVTIAAVDRGGAPTGPPAAVRRPYSVRLDYFKQMPEARRSMAHFRDLGLDPYWVKVDLGARGVWYRVFAGQFESLADAEAFIGANGLRDASVKQTRYANRLGTFASRADAEAERLQVVEQGLSPYLVDRSDGAVEMYVGAYPDRQGAEAQRMELAAGGIRSDIVQR